MNCLVAPLYCPTPKKLVNAHQVKLFGVYLAYFAASFEYKRVLELESTIVHLST